MALTGSDWNLRKTFLVLEGTRRFVASTGAESFGPSLVLVSLLGSMLVLVGAFGVLVSFYLMLYACTMSIMGTYFSKDIVFRFIPADFEK